MHLNNSLLNYTGDMSQIKLPPRIRKRGRPKGADKTVLGLPKKKSRKGPTPFSRMAPQDKEKGTIFEVVVLLLLSPTSYTVILSWFLRDTSIIDEVVSGRLVTASEIEECEKVSMKITEDQVTLARVQKYLTRDAWVLLETIADQKVAEEWCCSICLKTLDSEQSIACDMCLDWFHFSCVALPKKRVWICRKCFTSCI